MATEIDICNLALSHLGDTANVASIDPPEKSAQAEHCARYYPMARDALLGMHTWNFCTTRGALNKLASAPASGWLYVYTRPNKALHVLALYPPGAQDDNDPQPFETEALPNGTQVIYADVADPVCRYTLQVTDPTQFPPAFVDALTWLLAAMLAGPIIKGKEGAVQVKRCQDYFDAVKLPAAKAGDVMQRRAKIEHTPSWVAAR